MTDFALLPASEPADLSFAVVNLCRGPVYRDVLALLRKRLAEFDATSADSRLVLSRDQLTEMLRLFVPGSTNDARLVDQIEAHVNKVVDLGLLRRLRGDVEPFEVRRILKAHVDGQWLTDFDARLDEYPAELARHQRPADVLVQPGPGVPHPRCQPGPA